jgi:hypothetical protein
MSLSSLSSQGRKTNLADDVADLLLGLLLGAQEALPHVVADAAAVQQLRQRRLRAPHVHDAADVLGRAPQQRRLEQRLRHAGLVLVVVLREQREVDVARAVLGEPGRERAGAVWRR